MELLNFTFECEFRRNRDSNVKFAPLAIRIRCNVLRPDNRAIFNDSLH